MTTKLISATFHFNNGFVIFYRAVKGYTFEVMDEKQKKYGEGKTSSAPNQSNAKNFLDEALTKEEDKS